MAVDEELLRALPKVDLHRHLEGSARVETVVDFAKEFGVELPTYDPDELRPHVEVTKDNPPDFHSFLSKFMFLRKLYPSREAIQRVAYECVEDAALDNVRYLEIRFSPAHFASRRQFPVEDVAGWVEESVRKGEKDFGVRVGLIITLGRNYGIEGNASSAEIALRDGGRHYVGLDLAGDEINFPAEPFKPFFDRAKVSGMGITVHAGEAAGPESVRLAVFDLHAQRIGHGIRVVGDPSLVEYCREHRIAFEVCPCSNLRTGVSTLATHPLKQLVEAGLLVSIGSDDPRISATTLSDDYAVATNDLGLSLDQLVQVILNGVEASFLPPAEKARLREQMQREISETIEKRGR